MKSQMIWTVIDIWSKYKRVLIQIKCRMRKRLQINQIFYAVGTPNHRNIKWPKLLHRKIS
jgi:hypothetical protein